MRDYQWLSKYQYYQGIIKYPYLSKREDGLRHLWTKEGDKSTVFVLDFPYHTRAEVLKLCIAVTYLILHIEVWPKDLSVELSSITGSYLWVALDPQSTPLASSMTLKQSLVTPSYALRYNWEHWDTTHQWVTTCSLRNTTSESKSCWSLCNWIR